MTPRDRRVTTHRKGIKKRKPFQHQQAVEAARRNEDTCRTRSNTNSKQHARAKSHKEEKTKQVAVTRACEVAPLQCERRRRRRPTPIEQMHAIHAEHGKSKQHIVGCRCLFCSPRASAVPRPTKDGDGRQVAGNWHSGILAFSGQRRRRSALRARGTRVGVDRWWFWCRCGVQVVPRLNVCSSFVRPTAAAERDEQETFI
jgi:hypothetical protein